MHKLQILDLERNEELDREAMSAVAGGTSLPDLRNRRVLPLKLSTPTAQSTPFRSLSKTRR